MAQPTAPTPWRVANGGMIVDANGREIVWIAARLNNPSGLDADPNGADPNGWRKIAAKMAAAPELEAAVEALLQDLLSMYASPFMAGVAWGPESGPNNEVVVAARAALAKARQC
jgi:hypothetical protein